MLRIGDFGWQTQSQNLSTLPNRYHGQGTCKFPLSKRLSNGRVADDTSMGAGQAYMGSGRRISSNWILVFISFGSLLMMMTRILHNL